MKKLLVALSVVASATLFTACEDTAVDFSIPFQTSAERDVIVDANGSFSSSDTATFSLESNSELKSNIDKVKDLVIKSISYQVSSLNSGSADSAAAVTGTISIDVLNGTTSIIGGAQTDTFVLSDLLANGEQTLDAALTSSSSTIIDLLEAGEELTTLVTLVGVNASAETFDFTTKATVKFSATAGGL